MIDEFAKVLVERLENKQIDILADYEQYGDGEDYRRSLLCDELIKLVNQLAEESNKRYEPTIDLIEHGVEGYNLHLKEQYRKGYEDAKKDNGWISCSEYVPQDGDWVLCYGKNREGRIKYEVSTYAHEIQCWMCSRIEEVIAWQPLPAPYEPKDELRANSDKNLIKPDIETYEAEG